MTEEEKEKKLKEKLDKEFEEKLKELKKRDPFVYKNF
jgi:hypothetical protein